MKTMKIKKSLPDAIISVAVLIFLGTLFAQVSVIPDISQGYPLGLLIIATALTLFLLARSLLRLRTDERVESRVPEQAKVIFPYCLMIIAYIWLLDKLGYIVSTIIFMIASLLFLKLKNKVLAVVLSVTVTLLLYYIFTNFLVIVLPKGGWLNIAF